MPRRVIAVIDEKCLRVYWDWKLAGFFSLTAFDVPCKQSIAVEVLYAYFAFSEAGYCYSFLLFIGNGGIIEQGLSLSRR